MKIMMPALLLSGPIITAYSGTTPKSRGGAWLISAELAVFIIVLVCANFALRRCPIFHSGVPRGLIAACVACLSSVALFFTPSAQSGFTQQPTHSSPVIEFVLVPYATLALALPFLLLLFLLKKFCERKTNAKTRCPGKTEGVGNESLENGLS